MIPKISTFSLLIIFTFTLPVFATERSDKKTCFGASFMSINQIKESAKTHKDLKHNPYIKLAPANGIYVHSVFKGLPADAAGLLPGDIIIRANNKVVHSVEGFLNMIKSSVSNAKPSKMRLEFWRVCKEKTKKPYPVHIRKIERTKNYYLGLSRVFTRNHHVFFNERYVKKKKVIFVTPVYLEEKLFNAYRLMSELTPQSDNAIGITWYKSDASSFLGEINHGCECYPYFGITAQGKLVLRLHVGYVGKSWLFFSRLLFRANGTEYKIVLNRLKDIDSEVLNGGFCIEKCDILSQDKIIKAIAEHQSNEIFISLLGNHRRASWKMTDSAKEGFVNIWKAYQSMLRLSPEQRKALFYK